MEVGQNWKRTIVGNPRCKIISCTSTIKVTEIHITFTCPLSIHICMQTIHRDTYPDARRDPEGHHAQAHT